MTTVDTPDQHSIEDVCAFLATTPQQCLKTLMVEGAEGGVVALVLRGDHELNAVKAQNLDAVATPLRFAAAHEIEAAVGCGPGSLGPVGLSVPCFVDHAAAVLADFVCGANAPDRHLRGVNWGRDLTAPDSVDLRNVTNGDPAPDGSGELELRRGIEVGHIFQLGQKYSAAMKASVLDENGKSVTMTMGCYGIGVSRIVAAAIEQNYDDSGIIWPAAIAPFHVAIAPVNAHKSTRVRELSETLYERFTTAGIDVLLCDNKERPGVMFANLDLIGIPHRLVLSDRGLDAGTLEYKGRTDDASEDIPLEDVLGFIQRKLLPSAVTS